MNRDDVQDDAQYDVKPIKIGLLHDSKMLVDPG